MKKHLNLTISGKLKHIGFRFMAMQAAYKYGVMGFARKKSNGSVYIEVEGEEENLANFLAWCKTGPVGAEIAEIETVEADLKDFTSFDIKN
jgi:acylphosphatase